jgi:two-component system invasion response regulator UvrY
MFTPTPLAYRPHVLIVEDHPLYRDALELIVLSCYPDARTTGVDSVLEAKRMLMEKHFDLLILDLELDDRPGMDILEECKFLETPPAVLVVSGHTRSDYVVRVLRFGALGYVSKAAPKEELTDAIQSVLNGKLALSTDVARTVAESTIFNQNLPAHSLLSARELEVILLLARGLQPKEIAARLNLSVRTIAVHKFKAFQKIGVKTLIDLFQYCREHNMFRYETDMQKA